MLILLGVIVVSAAFHELGHAAALRYAGGQVKGMGAGLYLVYPAFFTDVSDNYRLPRWSRVRTDLGGFYFNLIFAIGVMALYLLTGQEFLLLIILLINLEIIHQLLPFVRLDGYWTLADLTGIPDFFSQMGAFWRSILPFKRWQGRKLPELKWWGKASFALYTIITVPRSGCSSSSGRPSSRSRARRPARSTPPSRPSSRSGPTSADRSATRSPV
jgi:putative peptide zinc metalloprotease protein